MNRSIRLVALAGALAATVAFAAPASALGQPVTFTATVTADTALSPYPTFQGGVYVAVADVDSAHTGGMLAGMSDGSVRGVSPSSDRDVEVVLKVLDSGRGY